MGDTKLPDVSKVNSPLSRKIGDHSGKVENPSALAVSTPNSSMYFCTATLFTMSADWDGLIQVVVVPRPELMFASPHVALPDTLINESVPVLPVVKTRPLLSASYSTFTPDTVLPVSEASLLMPFSSSTMKLSSV